MYVYVCMYIYIYRERERERDTSYTKSRSRGVKCRKCVSVVVSGARARKEASPTLELGLA